MNLLFILLASFLIQVEIQHTYKTACVIINSDGKTTLRIWDTKKGKKYKIEQARIDAVQSILYEGYSGGKCGYLPPLLKHKEDVIEFEEKNLYFFKKSGDYADYVISSEVSASMPVKMKDKNSAAYEVRIDIKKLDQYLVSEKIKDKTDDNY